MATRPYPLAALGLSIALGGAAASLGCAVIYDFSDYGASGASGGGAGGSGGGMGTSTTLWAQHFGGIGPDVVGGHHGVDTDPLGTNVYLTGSFSAQINLGKGPLTSTNHGFFLANLDPLSGKAAWAKPLADATSGDFSALAAVNNGVVVAGGFDISATLNGLPGIKSAGLHDIFLARYDALGNYMWGKTYGDGQQQDARAVAVDAMGRVYLTGQFIGTLDFGSPCAPLTSAAPVGFIAQFTSGGACVWAFPFGTQASGQSLAVDNTGVFIGGSCSGVLSVGGMMMNCSTDAPFIAKVNFAGTSAFVSPLSTGVYDVHLAGNPAGGVFYGATAAPLGQDSGRLVAGALTSSGVPDWSMTYPGVGQLHLNAITYTPSGELLITGLSRGPLDFLDPAPQNHGLDDMFLVRLSAAGGTALGGIQFGDAERQSGWSVHADAMGNAYLYGDFQQGIDFGTGTLTTTGDYDLAIAKFRAGAFP